MINPAEITELETFFASVNLPKQLKINKAVTFQDLPSFVKDNLAKLKSGDIPDVVAVPRLDDLQRIKYVLVSGETF